MPTRILYGFLLIYDIHNLHISSITPGILFYYQIGVYVCVIADFFRYRFNKRGFTTKLIAIKGMIKLMNKFLYSYAEFDISLYILDSINSVIIL